MNSEYIRYGECYLLKKKVSHGNDLFILKIESYTQVQRFKSGFHQFEHRLKLRNPYIIQMVGLDHQVEEKLLYTEYKVDLFFEYIYDTLENMLKYNGRLKLSTNEIWYMLYCISKGMVYLQKNGLYNGDIQLKNVFVGKNNKQIIILIQDTKYVIMYYLEMNQPSSDFRRVNLSIGR